MKNQNGYDVLGLVIKDASLIRNISDLTNGARQSFLLFQDRFMSILVAGSYWEQQSKSNAALGLRTANTHRTKVTLASIDAQGAITNVATWRIAYVQLAVDPADFKRPFELFQ
jgi:predicted HAD superfamily phosphohydrolase